MLAEPGAGGDDSIAFTKTQEGQARHKAWADKQPMQPLKRGQGLGWEALLPKLLMVLFSTAGLVMFGYRMWLQNQLRTQGPYVRPPPCHAPHSFPP